MPKVEQRVLSPGEIQELKRLQAIYAARRRKIPSGAHLPTFYRPRLMDSVT